MELTGLDIAIRRMQSIERQFQSLASLASSPAPDKDFQSILEANMTEKSQTETPNETQALANNFREISPKGASREELENLIEKYADKNNLDSDFVKAVIKQESGFKANAKSHCGAMGLMQLMPATAMSLGVNNAYDPEQNIAGGTKYLKGLMDRFGGDKELALAAYNAGPGAVNKYGGIPPYKETRNYVKNIMSSYQNLKNGGGV